MDASVKDTCQYALHPCIGVLAFLGHRLRRTLPVRGRQHSGGGMHGIRPMRAAGQQRGRRRWWLLWIASKPAGFIASSSAFASAPFASLHQASPGSARCSPKLLPRHHSRQQCDQGAPGSHPSASAAAALGAAATAAPHVAAPHAAPSPISLQRDACTQRGLAAAAAARPWRRRISALVCSPCWRRCPCI